MKKLILILCLIMAQSIWSQSKLEKDKKDILEVLDMQTEAWNKNDLEGFMKGYWQSEELKFFGASGLTSGWENTLNNYKKGYPSSDHTGILNFKIHSISPINEGAYYVMGEFFLERKVGDANGVFMIIFKKIQGEWKIIADTSC
ncbi:YybH family protein [Namhaeicola litoreus]|uniref:YybH family protein n=1 Tax=Namhaeicola litoreus TaxID=1052145 RepID=A0ABW3Y0Y7_9FLAO